MRYQKISTFIILLAFNIVILVQGCALPTRLPAVPQSLVDKAEVSGMPGIRYVAVGDMTQFTLDWEQAFEAELLFRAQIGQLKPLPPVSFLALSGGGDDGAFGAGLLCGWTVAGNRPEFKLVTGVSAGALIAPFAFLGPKYDTVLKKLFTNFSPKDIVERRSLLAAVFDDALADNKPLWRLLEKKITADLLREIAQEHAKGRRLLVATTNLDTRLSVIWNMTKIAASGHPQSLDLFRKILMASAAIPAAFPPVMIDVVAEGKHYQEMHVDGGASRAVFIYPVKFKLNEFAAKANAHRERKMYIIRNSRLDPGWAEVDRRTYSIAEKAITSLIRTQGIGDLFRLYATTQRDGIDFNLAYIPSTFSTPHMEEFDTNYMRDLFKTGYDAAVAGYSWEKTPPGL